MLKRLTKFADATLDRWSPFRLRKRINELHESVERIFETKEDMIDAAHAFVLKENEKLRQTLAMVKNALINRKPIVNVNERGQLFLCSKEDDAIIELIDEATS